MAGLSPEHSPEELNQRDTMGNTALMTAVTEGNQERVLHLLEQPGIDVNIQNASHNSALLLAVELPLPRAKPDIIRALLDKPDIQVNLQDRQGATALCKAVAKEHKESILALLGHPDTDTKIRNTYGDTPFMLCLSKQALREDTEVLDAFLNHQNMDVNQSDMNGETPLIVSAKAPDTTAMVRLLQQPGIQVNKQDNKGRTALMTVLLIRSKPNLAALDLLLQRTELEGNLKNHSGWSAIYGCMDEECMGRLLEHPNIDIHLLQQGKFTRFRKNFQNDRIPDIAMADLMSHHPKFEVNALRADGHTDLTWAAMEGKDKMVRYLLSHPQVNVSQCDTKQRSPLMYLAQNFKVELMTELMEHKSFDEEDYSRQDGDGKTFLHHLFQQSSEFTTQTDMESISKVVDTRPVNLSATDNKGYTALMRTIEFAKGKVPAPPGLPEVMKSILQRSAKSDLEVKNTFNMSALSMVRENSQNLEEKVRSMCKLYMPEERPASLHNLSTAEHLKLLRGSLHTLPLPQDMTDHLIQQVDKLESDVNTFTGGKYGHELGMLKVHRDKLQGLHVFLMQNLDRPREVVGYLYSQKIISLTMKQELDAIKLRTELANKLLSILPTRGPQAYQCFIDALNETGQEHVASVLEEYQPEEEKTDQALVPHGAGSLAMVSSPTSQLVALNVTPGRPMALTFMVRAGDERKLTYMNE